MTISNNNFNNGINVYIHRCRICNDKVEIYNNKDLAEFSIDELCYLCKCKIENPNKL